VKNTPIKCLVDGIAAEVIYIDYEDGHANTVVTREWIPKATNGPYWRNYFWYFFPDGGDKTYIRAYNEGSGGDIQAPSWADGYNGCYWMADCVVLTGEPKNAKRLKTPRKIKLSYSDHKTTINPFAFAETTTSIEYCKVCEENSHEYCDEHMYEDGEGRMRYREDDSAVE
jgi:hypothetical protein